MSELLHLQAKEKESPVRRTENLWSITLIELTSFCNFSCSFCPIDTMDRVKSTMPRALWKKILRELGENKMTRTVFFHLLGDPLVSKDVFDAIEMANQYGLEVSLYTNGALLDEERGTKLLDVLQKGRIVLSMQDIIPDSFHERSHDNLSWNQYIERLQNFMHLAQKRKNAPPIQVHCLFDMISLGWDVLRIYREQKKIQTVYDQWRAALGFREKQAINVFDPTASYPLGDNLSFYVKHLTTWDNQHIDASMEVVPKETGHCDLMTDTFAILADGTCTYCCADYEGKLQLGNAHHDSLEDIYYGAKSAEIRAAEEKGRFISKQCQVCKGTLVKKKNGKPIRSRIRPTDFYIFKEHLGRYGLKSSIRKIGARMK